MNRFGTTAVLSSLPSDDVDDAAAATDANARNTDKGFPSFLQ
jgi:hypothetical protein